MKNLKINKWMYFDQYLYVYEVWVECLFSSRKKVWVFPQTGKFLCSVIVVVVWVQIYNYLNK